jgi:hypothetical protein
MAGDGQMRVGHRVCTLPCAACADERQALEQRRRCITRPAPANERVQTNAAERVVPTVNSSTRRSRRAPPAATMQPSDAS